MAISAFGACVRLHASCNSIFAQITRCTRFQCPRLQCRQRNTLPYRLLMRGDTPKKARHRRMSCTPRPRPLSTQIERRKCRPFHKTNLTTRTSTNCRPEIFAPVKRSGKSVAILATAQRSFGFLHRIWCFTHVLVRAKSLLTREMLHFPRQILQSSRLRAASSK